MKGSSIVWIRCFFYLWLCFASVARIAGQGSSNPTNSGEFFPVDLSRFVTTVFSNAPQGTTWSYLPRGLQVMGGIPFRIDGKFEVTGIEGLKGGNEYIPTRVSGIPIGRTAEKLVLLHATGFTEKDGTPLANLVLHYAGGKEQSLRMIYGVHVRNWYEDRYEKKKSLLDPNSTVVWNGDDDSERNTPVRLHRTIFANPLPNIPLESVDVVSLFSHSPPIIFALTIQNGGPDLKPITSSAAQHVINKGEREPDSTYARTMRVRPVAAESGELLTNSTLFVTVADDTASYLWGAYRAASDGLMSFDYPPPHTLFINLLVKSPGRAPLFLTPARQNTGRFPVEIAAKLQPGQTIGGTVKDDSGKPVPDAEILVSSVSRTKVRTYTQIDYDQVRSDSSGNWRCQSMPRSFSNLVLTITHPEYRATTYVDAATNKAVNVVPPVDLVTQKGVLTLQHGLLVQGTVKTPANQPVANAEVFFIETVGSAKPRRSIRTGADGKYKFVATAESGEAAVAVIARGFAPRYEAFFLDNNLKPVDFTMGPGGQLKLRLTDQQQAPIPSALVKLDSWYGLQLFDWRTTTDDSGHAVWTNAPDGPLLFSFSKTNFFNMRANLTASSGEMNYMLRKMSAAVGTVVDAETKKPIDEFTIVKGHSYSPGEPIRWNRYSGSTSRGRNGRYSVRLEDYYNGQTRIMIEAPGYMPALSEIFTKPGWYTNDFELKKGHGINGIVVLASGEPVPNCSVVIVDPGTSAYLDQTGEFRQSSGNGDYTRTDARGHFEFPPKAESQTLMAACDKGFVQVPGDKLPEDGKVVLQPWGHIKGVVKVGPPGDSPKSVVAESKYGRYGAEAGRDYPALSLQLRATPDAAGNFVFPKVPPGLRTVGIYHEIRSSYRSTSSTSHAVPTMVKPGETNEVVIGGLGRTLLGHMVTPGGNPRDVDWKRDLNSLTLRLEGNPELESVTMPALKTEEERQAFYAARNERIKQFWMTDKGRELQLKQRSYVLDFDTNGTFRVYNVPPGTYDLYVSLTQSEDEESSSYQQIGYASKQIVIPDGATDEPFDCGGIEIRVRRNLRIGQTAPAFEGKSLDGKAIKLEDFKGKYVLIDFCAKWSGSYGQQIQNLKALNDTYGKDGRLVILSLSVDYQEQTARELMKEMGVTWTACYLGGWSETTVPASFGVEGIPHAVLIGPDGKVLAKNLKGSYLRTAVRNAIERRTASRL